MPTYRYLAVDHSLAAVAARHGQNLEQLWTLNDTARRHRRAQDWAHSVGYTEQILIDFSRAETSYEWDFFDQDEGNISLQEFCDRRNAERAERQRQGRPVGPTITPELLWHALANEDFRYQHILRESRSRGATSGQVQALEDNPGTVYVRATSALGLFVPMVPVSSRRPAAAVPNGTTRVLVTMPHWIRQLLEMKSDIEHAAAALRAIVARERGVRSEFADALTSFSRMDEFLRILVEGRSGTTEPRTYAAADRATLDAIEGLRRQLFGVQQRVADLARRRREAVAGPGVRDRHSERLRSLIRDRAFSALYRRAVVEDARAYGERVAPQVQATVLNSYRLAVDAALPWAEHDVHEALSPTQLWWETIAVWLPLATALFVPMFGNLAGPPSVAVWLAQWRAAKELSGVLSNLGSNQAAELQQTMQRIVARWAGGRRIVITLGEYEQWLGRVSLAENMFNAVLRGPEVAGVEAGAANGIRVAPASADVRDQLIELDRWMAAGRQAEAEVARVRAELTPAQQAAGRSTLALKNQVIQVLEDQTLTVAQRREALRNIANGDLTGSVQTGHLATGGLLFLNLLAIAAGVVNFLGQPDHSLTQYAELTANMVGGTATSALAILQLFANRSEASWAATVLQAHSRTLGHIAAGLALVQATAALISTIDTYGTSRPLALAGNVMAVASGALLWIGWAATLEGFAVGASLTGIGLPLGLAAAVLGLAVNWAEEDEKTKKFFVNYLTTFGRSTTVRQLDSHLIDSPDRGTTIQLALRDVRVAAQRLTFPLAVWEEINNLTRLGFSLNEAQTLSAAQATYAVGALDPAVSRQAFIRQVNETFHPTP